MLEKIPVGGWRHAESRVVEVFAGKAKARDVVPNWPRGRSTSKPIQRLSSNGFMISTEPYFLLDGFNYAGFQLECKETTEEWDEFNAEERRKAEMMEGWYEQQRIEARGPLYPQKDDGFAVYRAKLDMLINEVKP